jgi:signal transduction histidine kinase
VSSRAALFALVALVLVATAGAALIIRVSAASINATVAAQAAEAPEMARLYVAKYGNLAKAAPAIVARITRDDLRVVLFDAESKRVFTSNGGWSGPRPPGRRGLDARPVAPDTFAGGPEGPPPGGEPGPEPRIFGGPAGPPPGERALLRSGRLFAAPGVGDGPPGANAWRRDWMRIGVAMLAGVTVGRVRIPGGFISIIPEPDPVLTVVRTVAIGLALVLAASAALLWLVIRAVRRAALRPLHETTLALQRLALRDFSPRTIMAGEGSAYDELARAYNAAVEAVSSAFAERRAAESEMQRFIADAGHELRTPLTIVMGYLDIIDGGALADPKLVGRVTSGMRTEAVRMRKLIDKLIVLARMETPSEREARTELDVVSLVARVIESLEPLAAQPIEVTGVPFAHVFANEDDVADALTNIVENALKYAPQSPVAVAIEQRAGQIAIEISDRGPGMSPDEQRNAFERFYRGERRGEVTGSGLGLAIAKRAIERAGGTVALRSIVGVGTTVRIELPAAATPAVEPAPAPLAHR